MNRVRVKNHEEFWGNSGAGVDCNGQVIPDTLLKLFSEGKKGSVTNDFSSRLSPTPLIIPGDGFDVAAAGVAGLDGMFGTETHCYASDL